LIRDIAIPVKTFMVHINLRNANGLHIVTANLQEIAADNLYSFASVFFLMAIIQGSHSFKADAPPYQLIFVLDWSWWSLGASQTGNEGKCKQFLSVITSAPSKARADETGVTPSPSHLSIYALPYFSRLSSRKRPRVAMDLKLKSFYF